jgi:hypothetical protein
MMLYFRSAPTAGRKSLRVSFRPDRPYHEALLPGSIASKA